MSSGDDDAWRGIVDRLYSVYIGSGNYDSRRCNFYSRCRALQRNEN